ncbi:hypothetical protein [Thermogemmatispora sp.]|uniref:pPIWI_RE_Z domain-containing protein n=1 Tax=Thermogemmatispora sp. TaxID=1968838 RepID=UPI002ACBEE45|nr:hypothetical protein [Thermogemmatispora sp.]
MQAILTRLAQQSQAAAEDPPTALLQLGARRLIEVELGLTLLSEVAPAAPAQALWVLLSGYSFALPELYAAGQEHVQMQGIGRHLLLAYKSARNWERALADYTRVSELLRLYDVDLQTGHYSRRSVSLYPERLELYRQLCRQPLPHCERKLRPAHAGRYLCLSQRRRATVTIPDDLPLPSAWPPGHQLPERHQHEALVIPWAELLETADWLDEQEARCQLPARQWRQALERIQLYFAPNETSEFQAADTLVLQGTLHMVGMVGTGKTTLMDVLAVWAARRGRRIALVVGDVTSLLERVQYFRRLGLSAVPLLGTTNRAKHRRQLHQMLSAVRGEHPLQHEHIGFDYTSSTCLLNGLRSEHSPPLPTDAPPCLSLQPIEQGVEEELLGKEDEEELIPPGDEEDASLQAEAPRGRRYACPLYAACPYHLGQRELVEATIWVATPQSLIYTSVDPQLCPPFLRFLELVYRLCDLVVVDEADRVQVQLDELFSPALTLVSKGGDSWLGTLVNKVPSALYREGLGQVRDERVQAWVNRLHRAHTAAVSIYGLLLRERDLMEWIAKQGGYFSSLTLLEKLAIAACGLSKDLDQSEQEKRYKAFWTPLGHFLDDPLGEHGEHELAALTRLAISLAHDGLVREQLQRWLRRQPYVCLDEPGLATWAVRLQFALLLEVLADSLDALFYDWREMEALFGLEGSSATLFYSPPPDYAPWLPDAPMGNILGFQYVRSSEKASEPGELRFFRCMGVGRWLLLHLHDFLAADGLAGPHALLLSGTSWAGTSPIYHLQVPVQAILLPPPQERQAIEKSDFVYRFARLEESMEATAVSGFQGEERLKHLEIVLRDLARHEHLAKERLPSSLDRLRAELPEGRQRILLVVGSYAEARHAYHYLLNEGLIAPGEAAYLVPDDAIFESRWSWQSADDRLPRGLVSELSKRNAWLLIAPLQAIERGHNILNAEGKAALGAVCFLVRPHPRPDDIHYLLHSVNRWAIEHSSNSEWLRQLCGSEAVDLEKVGKRFRQEAFAYWQHLLHLRLRYSSLPNWERRALTWTLLVAVWQVIGRLVRGGCPALVLFCDARFAPRQAATGESDYEHTSLIRGMQEVLRPYFEPDDTQAIPPRERHLVQILYGPLYYGLNGIEEREQY